MRIGGVTFSHHFSTVFSVANPSAAERRKELTFSAMAFFYASAELPRSRWSGFSVLAGRLRGIMQKRARINENVREAERRAPPPCSFAELATFRASVFHIELC